MSQYDETNEVQMLPYWEDYNHTLHAPIFQSQKVFKIFIQYTTIIARQVCMLVFSKMFSVEKKI